jgi:hypothetical protein
MCAPVALPLPAGEGVVTCGEGHIKFWSRAGPNLASQRAAWSKACAKQTMLVVQAVGALTLTAFACRLTQRTIACRLTCCVLLSAA